MLDRLMTHPKRKWIVTTGTLMTGLIFLLPAVDSFNAERSRCAELQAELAETGKEVGRLTDWRQLLARKTAELDSLERRAFTLDGAEQFRVELVDVVRRTGCTMRRIHLDQPRFRDWLETEDNPLEDRPPKGADGETPFSLMTHQLALTVEGPLSSVQRLLSEIQSEDRMLHAASVSLRQSDGSAGRVTLDLELLLFDLLRKLHDVTM